ncbi:hypothetical protein [Pseudodesulfovibrio tunisiensis]|uniref:hypothetical protein n=1 Tax=Pseudodesulfovibrio tunisiensis TaxID=463192 RepID=UPI001FB544E1|nr:hypothetical protein [Pseudodesulfovibrio tunisiensis]
MEWKTSEMPGCLHLEKAVLRNDAFKMRKRYMFFLVATFPTSVARMLEDLATYVPRLHERFLLFYYAENKGGFVVQGDDVNAGEKEKTQPDFANLKSDFKLAKKDWQGKPLSWLPGKGMRTSRGRGIATKGSPFAGCRISSSCN